MTGYAKSLWLAVLLVGASGGSGCGMWMSGSREVRQGDLPMVNPYDGATVYPLQLAHLGAAQRIARFAKPLSLLKSRMYEESPYAAIRAADCGMLAMYSNDTALARRALDRALALSEGAKQDTSQVAKVSGIRGAERHKVFAGEPHELASLYIARGLVYLADNDPENAKSCFLRASLEDAHAEQGKNRANWLIADTLAVLSFRLYGNNVRAEDHCTMMRRLYAQSSSKYGWVDLAKLKTLTGRNLTVVVAAIGNPPVKYGKGRLVYADSGSKVGRVRVQGTSAWLTDNVYVQAVTRGSRSMDKILALRQQQKRNTEDAGSVALTTASVVGGPIGLAIQLIAGAAIDSAHKIDVDADSRTMSAIPGRYYVWTSNRVMPGDALTVELVNASGNQIARGKAVLPNGRRRGPNVLVVWFPY